MPKHVSMTNEFQGFYVDQDGEVRTTTEVISGIHFEFENKKTYTNVKLVVTNTGEVRDEYVLWPSLEALTAGGVDVSGFKPKSQNQE